MAVSGADALQGYCDINMPWFVDRGVMRVYGDHSVHPKSSGRVTNIGGMNKLYSIVENFIINL